MSERGRQHETDELRYSGEPLRRLAPLVPDLEWPQLPDGYDAYDVTYEIDVADRTPRAPRCRCTLVPVDAEVQAEAMTAMARAFDEADRELDGLRRTIESGEDYGLLAALEATKPGRSDHSEAP